MSDLLNRINSLLDEAIACENNTMNVYARFAEAYEELGKHNIDVTVFSNKDFNDKGSINLPIVKLNRWGQFNIIPLVNKGVQFFFPYDRWLFGLRKSVQEMDILNSWEIYNAFSYQAIKTGKPTVITVIDNIPFNSSAVQKDISE